MEAVDGVTHLLKAWSGGDEAARDELIPKVYIELRRIAARYMRKEASGNTLQTTALVHEVFLRLVTIDSVTWQDRAHFFAVSATMMRRILVDRAHAKRTVKRGGRALCVSLDEAPEIAAGSTGGSKDRDIVAIDEALTAREWFLFAAQNCSSLADAAQQFLKHLPLHCRIPLSQAWPVACLGSQFGRDILWTPLV